MQKFFQDFFRNLVIGIIVFIVLTILNFIANGSINIEKLPISLGFVLLYTFSLSYANQVLFDFLDKKFSDDRFSKKRLIIGFISSFFLSLFVIFILRLFEETFINGRTLTQFIKDEKPTNYVTAITLTFIITLILYFIGFYKKYKESQLQEQKIIAGTASAQFESLKNQIDPHFLFNSLNVLSSLIEENPPAAQKFTTSLSKVYRYVLDQRDKELVTVDEEISFAKTYMNLLKMRFENSITFELPEPLSDEEAKVVPLSLQLLLENCIKHNIVSEKKPLNIKIYIENNELVIENNLQKKEILSDRKGVGLENIVNRYAILTKRNVKISESENSFKVKIPILTKKISTMESATIYNENLAFEKARDRVKQLKDFYGNLTSYTIVICFLAVINLWASSRYLWFLWPAAGWGIGVLFHAIGTFGISKDWEERKIQEIMNKNNNKSNWN